MKDQNYTIVKGGAYVLPVFIDDLLNLEDFDFTFAMATDDAMGSPVLLSKTTESSTIGEIEVDSIDRKIGIVIDETDIDYNSAIAAGNYWFEIWGTYTGGVLLT